MTCLPSSSRQHVLCTWLELRDCSIKQTIECNAYVSSKTEASLNVYESLRRCLGCFEDGKVENRANIAWKVRMRDGRGVISIASS